MSQNLNSAGAVARALDLALEGMRLANVLTPGVAAVFRIVKQGREDGKDDEAIKKEAMAVNDDTITEADRQLAVRPNQ